MGIDKQDVRLVLHSTISKNLDCYFQETGRAGRDGLVANCVTFYKKEDASKIKFLIRGNNFDSELVKLNQLLAFMDNVSDCRRYVHEKHFNNSATLTAIKCERNSLSMCDNCERSL